MNAQTIVTPSGERLVILPESEFDALMAAAADAADSAAVALFRSRFQCDEEELVPADVVDRILRAKAGSGCGVSTAR